MEMKGGGRRWKKVEEGVEGGLFKDEGGEKDMKRK